MDIHEIEEQLTLERENAKTKPKSAVYMELLDSWMDVKARRDLLRIIIRQGKCPCCMEEFQYLMKHLAQSLECVGGKDGVGTMVLRALRKEAKAVKYKTYSSSEKGKFRHHAYDQTDRGVSRRQKHQKSKS